MTAAASALIPAVSPDFPKSPLGGSPGRHLHHQQEGGQVRALLPSLGLDPTHRG